MALSRTFWFVVFGGGGSLPLVLLYNPNPNRGSVVTMEGVDQRWLGYEAGSGAPKKEQEQGVAYWRIQRGSDFGRAREHAIRQFGIYTRPPRGIISCIMNSWSSPLHNTPP
jgi:hypothetical protein